LQLFSAEETVAVGVQFLHLGDARFEFLDGQFAIFIFVKHVDEEGGHHVATTAAGRPRTALASLTCRTALATSPTPLLLSATFLAAATLVFLSLQSVHGEGKTQTGDQDCCQLANDCSLQHFHLSQRRTKTNAQLPSRRRGSFGTKKARGSQRRADLRPFPRPTRVT